jgi:hypothetical protein
MMKVVVVGTCKYLKVRKIYIQYTYNKEFPYCFEGDINMVVPWL